MKKYFSSFAVFLFGLYLLKLTLSDSLQLYINSNNIWYTILTGIVSTCIGITGIAVLIQDTSVTRANEYKKNIYAVLLYIPLIATLLFGLLLPAKPLLYNSSNFIPITPPPYANKSVNNTVISRLLGFNTSQYFFAEWYLVGSLSPDYQYQNGKPVDLTGQIFTLDPTNHTFYFGRLYITCCVIDARPFAYPVHYLAMQNQASIYQQNEWLRIQGTFVVDTIRGKRELAIVPFTIQVVSEPKNPYMN